MKEKSWIESYNSIMLKRYDGEQISIDMLESPYMLQIFTWIHKKSIKDVELMDRYFRHIQAFTQQPLVITYTNNSKESLEFVNKILP